MSGPERRRPVAAGAVPPPVLGLVLCLFLGLFPVLVGCASGGGPTPPVHTRDRHYREACSLLHPWTAARLDRARREFARTDRPGSWRRGIDDRLATIAATVDPAARDRALYDFRFEFCTPEGTE